MNEPDRGLLARLMLAAHSHPEARDLLALQVEPIAAHLDNRKEVMQVLRAVSPDNIMSEQEMKAPACLHPYWLVS